MTIVTRVGFNKVKTVPTGGWSRAADVPISRKNPGKFLAPSSASVGRFASFLRYFGNSN
jgi:hypothetical protein